MPRLPRPARLALRAVLLALVCAAALEGTLRVARQRVAALRVPLFSSSEPVLFDDARTLEELLGRTILGFRPRAEFAGFVLNSRSFRTREYRREKAPGVYRVVALGDSFTFSSGGVPHAAHWPTLLEGRLATGLGREVELLNLGYPAVGPRFERRLWQLEAAALEADLVLLALYPANDLVEEQGRERLGNRHPGLSERLADWSLLYRAARNLHRMQSGVQVVAAASPPGPPREQGGLPVPGYTWDGTAPTFTRERYVEITGELLAFHAAERRALMDELVLDLVATVTALAGEVRASGARCQVVLIPAEFQVDQAVHRAALVHVEALGLDPGGVDAGRAWDAIKSGLEQAQVDCLDLLPVMRAAVQRGDGPFYALRDTHWNPRGAALAAAQIAGHLLATR